MHKVHFYNNLKGIQLFLQQIIQMVEFHNTENVLKSHNQASLRSAAH